MIFIKDRKIERQWWEKGKKKKKNSFDSRGTLKFRVENRRKRGVSIIKKNSARETHPFLIIHAETRPGLVRSDFYGKPAIRMDVFSRSPFNISENSPPDFHLSFHFYCRPSPPFPATISSRTFRFCSNLFNLSRFPLLLLFNRRKLLWENRGEIQVLTDIKSKRDFHPSSSISRPLF